MLSQLFIRDFAIVPKLELTLGAGLTVLTGETGAGKSIIIDALALALGERASSGVIRQGAQRAEITAGFELDTQHDAATWLRDNDLFDDKECVLRRMIFQDKASKAYINGRPVPIQMLRSLGELLVDVHGQHEHQSLLRREAQRQILDDYAEINQQVTELGDHHRDIKSLESRIQTLRQQSDDRNARLELLRYQVKELERLDLSAQEIPQLEEEHARLANGATLLEGVQSAVHSLYDDDEYALAQGLGQITHKLEALARHDPSLEQPLALLQEAAIQFDEAASALHHYLDGLDLDPQRLQWLEQRLSDITDLARKHHVAAEVLPQILERLQQELTDTEDADTSVERLEQQLNTLRGAYFGLAQQISEGRAQAAQALGRQISEHMQELGMPGGSFAVGLTALPEGELSAHGLERIEFLVSANPGQALQPLTKVASGGELSRISLALQVVIASLGRIPTLIFDEVDVGIGGRVAEIVGKRLRKLGATRQVLCITHLAQVAAQGRQHLQVSKRSRQGHTSTYIEGLPGKKRVQEIARMIGGVEISQQTLDHAEDMLNRASA